MPRILKRGSGVAVSSDGFSGVSNFYQPGPLPPPLGGGAPPTNQSAAPALAHPMHEYIPLPTDEQPEDGSDCPVGREPFEYICGTAGVGKTQLAKRIAELYKGTELAATTGIASVNLGEGTTINALLKYFDADSLRENYTDGRLHTILRHLRNTGLRRIVLDEVSMLDGRSLTYMVRAIREVNEGKHQQDDMVVGADDEENEDRQTDHTGDNQIGLTLVGDFGQLPPVPDTDHKSGKKIPVQFAFESAEWGAFAPHITKLTKIWRQDAQDFISALHAVRRGDRRALDFFTPDRFSDQTDDTFAGSTIFAKNDAVDRYNQLRLDELRTTPMFYQTERTGKQRGDWKQIPDRLTLKEGALVMILANRRLFDKDSGDHKGAMIYANGDLGTILEQDGGVGWLVRLHRNNRVVRVLPIIRTNTIPLEPGRRKELIALYGRENLAQHIPTDINGAEEKKEIIGTVLYMPLRCAYGCTVHKTQGLTLDSVQVNIRDPFFQHPGMLFVALSRARTAEGLRIVGSPDGFAQRCTVNPRVAPWL
jgi:hypothetical protein